jgi:predicted transposase/invertase (TIGR01784 family)
MERLNPLNDYLFQRLMGESGDEEQLIAFLKAVLACTYGLTISSIEIIESKTFTAEVLGGKQVILDIRAVINGTIRVNIEIQLRNQWQMDRRSLYYWGREFTDGIDAGEDYGKLPRVIAINILDFEFLPLEKYHTVFRLREDEHRDYVLTDALEIHFIDMVKFRRLKEKDYWNNGLVRWLMFFDRRTSPGILEEILKMDTTIAKVQEKLVRISSDKETMRMYRMREMALSDYTTNINGARAEGRVEGERIGEQRARQEFLDLLKSGIPPEEILRRYGSA